MVALGFERERSWVALLQPCALVWWEGQALRARSFRVIRLHGLLALLSVSVSRDCCHDRYRWRHVPCLQLQRSISAFPSVSIHAVDISVKVIVASTRAARRQVEDKPTRTARLCVAGLLLADGASVGIGRLITRHAPHASPSASSRMNLVSTVHVTKKHADSTKHHPKPSTLLWPA